MEPQSLYHYGVKGMKWGVRRSQAALDRAAGRKARRETKRRAKRRTKEYRERIVANAPTTKAISKKEFDNLSKSPVKVGGKQTSLYRVGGSNTSSSLGEISYVTTSKQDNDRYVALLAPEHGRSKKKFQMDIEASKAIVSPSKKERVETFIETLSADVPHPYNSTTIKGRNFFESDPVDKALSDFELGLKKYNQFAQTQGMNTPMHSKYFDKIKSRGYNALVDDADAGLVSEMPILIFPENVGASVTSVSEISKDQVRTAQANLQDLDTWTK